MVSQVDFGLICGGCNGELIGDVFAQAFEICICDRFFSMGRCHFDFSMDAQVARMVMVDIDPRYCLFQIWSLALS